MFFFYFLFFYRISKCRFVDTNWKIKFPTGLSQNSLNKNLWQSQNCKILVFSYLTTGLKVIGQHKVNKHEMIGFSSSAWHSQCVNNRNHSFFFLTLAEQQAWQSSSPMGLSNKLSFHMVALPFSSLSPLPWCVADVAIGAWDPNKVRSGAVMSWYPVSVVRPETDPFCKNRRWERKRGGPVV